MSIKVDTLQIENVKRVRAVAMRLVAEGLTVIGGDNRQGKTSILDGIAYALGGERKRPTNLQREDSSALANVKLIMSNGLTVERKGKNASLHVTDPSGQKAGQRLLDTFVEELALDLPKFLQMSDKGKAEVLLRILGIEEQLAALEAEEKAAYDARTLQGRIAESKTHHAAEMPEHHDVPETPLSSAELVQQSQDIMTRNAERQQARNDREKKVAIIDQIVAEVMQAEKAVQRLNEEFKRAEQTEIELRAKLAVAQAELVELKQKPINPDESTEAVRLNIDSMEQINAKVRANLDKRKALEDAEVAEGEYARLGIIVDDIRNRKLALLDGVEMPLPGLSVEGCGLTYAGKAWDCMSSVEQIRASIAIIRKLKPECGFVLLDGLECMDCDELASLDQWLTENDLQAIATRVSRGSECTIIIEDGMIAGSDAADVLTAEAEPLNDATEVAAGMKEW